MSEHHWQPVMREALGEIWTSDEAYRTLWTLCDEFGHRFGGSASEHAAAAYLEEAFQRLGLRVWRETFPVYSWERGECFFALAVPVERSFSAIALPYTGVVDIEAPIVDAGAGEADDFARLGQAARGAMVLVDAERDIPGQTSSHRTDKYRRAVEAGAVACLFTNRNPGQLHITGALYARNPGGPTPLDHTAPIPGLGLTYEAGEALRRLAVRGPLRGRIRTRNRVFRSLAHNIVAELPGAERANEIILLGAHYDGHDIAQGALDNAAGTAVLLATARALAPFAGRLPRTLRFVCFACEELGLLGSWRHAESYQTADGPRLVFMLNLDGAGRGQGGSELLTVAGDEEVARAFTGLAHHWHGAFAVRDAISAHSDHFPFFLAGYPVATLQSRDATRDMIGRGWGHTEADTVDKVTLTGLRSSAAVTVQLALWLATAEHVPGRRRSPEAIRTLLETSGLVDALSHHWGRANRADLAPGGV